MLQTQIRTHQLYQRLLKRDPALLQELETLALQYKEENQHPLHARLAQRLAQILDAPIDFARLVALLRKNFEGCDLTEVDFRGMKLKNANFRRAVLRKAQLQRADLSGSDFTEADLTEVQAERVHLYKANLARINLSKASLAGADLTEANLYSCNLTGANLTNANLTNATCFNAKAWRCMLDFARLVGTDWSRADLTEATLRKVKASRSRFVNTCLAQAKLVEATLTSADLSNAQCDYADFGGADLRRACLTEANFFCARLQKTRLEGADLASCSCDMTYFGETLRVNANTCIDRDNHELIGMLLLSRALNVEQEQFALYVRYRQDLCWRGFTRLLARQKRSMSDWAYETLMQIGSLQASVKDYKEALQAFLHERNGSIDISDIDSSLHQVLSLELGRHTALSNLELYWYLRGVVETASVRLDRDLDESQKLTVLARLAEYTGYDQ